MKQFVCLACALGFVVSVLAQMPSLPISSTKTTSLIFPFPVKHVDRGTKDVLVQQVAEAENILLVKAATQNFSETNLSVITGDGSLYSFSVCYDPAPATWVYRLPVQKEAPASMYAKTLLDNPPVIKRLRARSGDVALYLTGIYVRGEVLYYQLRIRNESPLDYPVDGIRFSIRDKKGVKRSAVQEIEVHPLLVTGNATLVKAGEGTTVVVAVKKHITTDQKGLVVDVSEKGEGRSLSLQVPGKYILHAIPLPDLQ